MKYLCVIPSYWPAFQYGGPIASVHCLNQILVKKGVDVSVFTTNIGQVSSIPVDKWTIIDGVKVHYFPVSNIPKFISTYGWQYSRSMMNSLAQCVRDYDIIYNVGIWEFPNLIACYYAKKYDIPLVLSPRGVLRKWAFNNKSMKKNMYFKLLFQRVLPKRHVIHFSSVVEKEDCAYRFSKCTQNFIVENGINVGDYEISRSNAELDILSKKLSGKKIIMFLGRIHKIKGLDILVKAFANIHSIEKDLHLLIIGNDENGYYKNIYKLIHECKISTSVTYSGALYGSDKVSLLKKSYALVMPSLSESFGMAALEAMVCSKPVVVSKAVPLAYYIKKFSAGFVINPSITELENALKSLLVNRERATAMGRNGRQLAIEHFNWDRIANSMINNLQVLLK